MHRRSYLELTGCTALAVLAGCAGVLNDDGNDDGGESIRATTRWAVPASASEQSLAGYDIRSAQPSEILGAHDEIAAEAVADRLADRSRAQRHLDVRDLERFVEVEPVGHPSLNAYVVFEGEFDATAVIETLGADETVDVERVGTYGEYELYDSGPGFAAHAVGDGTIVEADRLRNEDVQPGDLKAVVEAANGESDRITDQHQGLRATADRLEPSHHLGLTAEDPEQSTDFARSQFPGAVASGMDAEIQGEQIELRTVLTFESERAREAAPLDQWFEEARAEVTSGEISRSIDGRFVDVTVTLPTSQLYG